MVSRWVSRCPLVLALIAIPAAAQLIPVGMPVPKTALPPVVFLDGYELTCGGTFSGTFGKFDQFLQASGQVSIFFDNCAYPGKPSIESLGNSFGAFLAALKYTDGTAVPQVDVVSHSMGGLIVRAYLAGMQPDGTFKPPPAPGIRKAVLLASPNFGTSVTDLAGVFGNDAQTNELALGSTFNFTLATWNQGIDDLRGVDALAVMGNDGVYMTINGQSVSDGVVGFTSASIGFAEAGRARIIPYCHISYSSLESIAKGLASFVCSPGAPGIAEGLNATDSNVQIVQSFLSDTIVWRTIGQAPADNAGVATEAGVIVRAKSAADQFVTLKDGTAGSDLNLGPGNATVYNAFVPSGAVTVKADVTTGGAQLQQAVTLNPGYTTALTLKPGPSIGAVIPAAALVTPRIVAPGTFVSIYGADLAAAATQASSAPFPLILGGTQVLVNGTAIPIQYVSPTQVNAVLPATLSGLVTLTVTQITGQHTVNVLTEAAVPAIFTADGTAASAINAVTGAVVTATSPLHGGDYVSLFLTGLGATTVGAGGLQYATIQPGVTVAGQACTVQFAGLSPQFPGVDQINCQIPMGLGANAAAPVIVTANGRSSNAATLVLQ
jgi:uncharacterized protein (TIGR03437 family)